MMKLAAGFLLLLLEGERLGLTCPGLKTRVNLPWDFLMLPKGLQVPASWEPFFIGSVFMWSN